MVNEAGQAAWIIDFEHAQPVVGGRIECCDFIQALLDGGGRMEGRDCSTSHEWKRCARRS